MMHAGSKGDYVNGELVFWSSQKVKLYTSALASWACRGSAEAGTQAPKERRHGRQAPREVST